MEMDVGGGGDCEFFGERMSWPGGTPPKKN